MKQTILGLLIISSVSIGCNCNGDDGQKECMDKNFDLNCCPQPDTTLKPSIAFSLPKILSIAGVPKVSYSFL